MPITAALATGLSKQVRQLHGGRVLRRDDGIEKLGRPLLQKWLERAQRKARLVPATGALHILRHYADLRVMPRPARSVRAAEEVEEMHAA